MKFGIDNSKAMAQNRVGEVKYFLIHHSACQRKQFHYEIHPDGSVESLLADTVRGQHPSSIGIAVVGDLDHNEISPTQLTALKQLVITLKLRFPSAKVGGHRQIRGDKTTSCPGKRFPLRDFVAWSKSELLDERDTRIAQDIESQYGP